VGELTIAVCAPVSNEPGQEKFGRLCKEIGVDMLTTHAWYKSHENALTYEYNDYIEPTIDRMKYVQNTWGLPLCPSVMVGEDNSPRTVQSEIFDPARGYPYSPIAVNNKPESVGGVVSKMLECMHNGTFHNPRPARGARLFGCAPAIASARHGQQLERVDGRKLFRALRRIWISNVRSHPQRGFSNLNKKRPPGRFFVDTACIPC